MGSELDQLEEEYAEYISFLNDIIVEQDNVYDTIIAYLENGGAPLIENFNGINKVIYLIS